MDAEQVKPSRSVSESPCEDSLAESRERYASMFTHHPHAAYSVDRNGYFTDANPVAVAMTGLSLEELRQSHFARVVHPEDLQLVEEGFERALTGIPQLVDARVLRADGKVFDIRATKIPVVVADEVVGVHGVAEDVTAAKAVLRELEKATAAKTLFLANVSHELRTPLSSIINATELLMDTELEPDSKHLVQVMHRNGERLLRLVSDILDFSRLEAGKLVLRPRPLDLRAVIAGVAEWAVPFAESRNLTVSFAVDESVPETVIGDGLRVSQVVTNLVQNAIKFTGTGGVDVRVSAHTNAQRAGSTTRGIWLEFRVTDTGIGIAEDRLQGLLEPFTQADPSATRGYEGAGLGLAICRDLADLMGGQLQASSRAGEGSTFTFGVPLESIDEDHLGKQRPKPAAVTGSAHGFPDLSS